MTFDRRLTNKAASRAIWNQLFVEAKMVTEFSVDRYFLTGGSHQQPIVRDVSEIWVNENECVSANDSRRLVFVERNLGDRTEAWISVVTFDEKLGAEVESVRWNAKHLASIEFKPGTVPGCRL